MNKHKFASLALIALCLGIWFGYRVLDRMRSDTAAPEITFSQETAEVSVMDPVDTLLQGVTAEDRRDGDVTASLVVESVQLTDSNGTVQVRYAAFDKAGNVAKAVREMRYSDYVSPRFSLSRSFAFPSGSAVDVLNLTHVEDMLDGDISHQVRATPLDTKSITGVGLHNVQFRVTNSLGDTVELVLPVEVYDSAEYTAGLELTDYLIYLKVGDTFRAENYLSRFVLNRDSVGLTGGLPAGFTLKTSGSVDTGTPGVYSVSFTVTWHPENDDTKRENAPMGYSRLIVVVEE